MAVHRQLIQAVDEAVHGHLHTALDERGLLLGDAALAVTSATVAVHGSLLLDRALAHWYPELQDAVDVQYDDEQAGGSRVQVALAFGSVTANLLATADDPPARSADLACAVFNLGVGMVDGVCDRVPSLGSQLLDVLEARDVPGAAAERRTRGWLLHALPRRLATDPTVAFTSRVIESFFELVHLACPGRGAAPVRAQVGLLVAEALEAERHSVSRSGPSTAHDHLVESSYRTSVWPFRVIELVATGDLARPAPTPGQLLGEAMWLIDDLVDLAGDATDGTLNAVLETALAEPSSGGMSPSAALRQLVRSGAIAETASRAAATLDAGLRAAPGAGSRQARQLFTSFVQQYAGLHLPAEQ